LVQEEFEAEKAALVAAHLNEIKLLKDELSRTESELLRSRTAAEARWVEAQGHRKEVAAAQGELKRLEAVLADRNAALESANQFIGQLKKRLSEFK